MSPSFDSIMPDVAFYVQLFEHYFVKASKSPWDLGIGIGIGMEMNTLP